MSTDVRAASLKGRVVPSSGVVGLKTSACKRRLIAHSGLMTGLEHVAAFAGTCVDRGAVCVWNNPASAGLHRDRIDEDRPA
jgi:hypothetical protein